MSRILSDSVLAELRKHADGGYMTDPQTVLELLDSHKILADLAAPDAAQDEVLKRARAWLQVHQRSRDGVTQLIRDLVAVISSDLSSAHAPDAARQARRETWEQVGVVLSGFGRNIRKVDLIEALERERLRAEGEKGEGNGRIEMA